MLVVCLHGCTINAKVLVGEVGVVVACSLWFGMLVLLFGCVFWFLLMQNLAYG